MTPVPEWRAEIARLAAGGWTARDFQRNQLGYAHEIVAGLDGPGRAAWVVYWRTVAELQRVLVEAGITPIFLKSRRQYPYHDSNVDVLIAAADWEPTQRALTARGWRLPSRAVRLKQRLIERAKLKLPPVREGLLPAHLYGAVTWRYQSDVGFLPPAGEREGWIERVTIGEAAGGDFGDGSADEILMPTAGADLLIHSAQTIFENYRLFYGEALFVRHLRRAMTPARAGAIQTLAEASGAPSVMPAVAALSADRARPGGARWPIRVPWSDLLRCWRERAAWRARSGHPIAGGEELAGYLVFAALYAGKRQVWDPLLKGDQRK